MRHWGWRPLVCGMILSVGAAGCNIVVERSTQVTPTDYPGVTLTVGRPPASDARTPPALSASPRASTPSTDAVFVPPPTCYESPAGGTICLGVIENRHGESLSLSGATLVISLSRAGNTGIVLATARPSFEQRAIPAGGIAPYRAAFQTAWDADLIGTAALFPARLDPIPAAAPALTASTPTVTPQNGRYTVAGSIINGGTTVAAGARALVTLRDDDGRVIGYRVVTFATTPILPRDQVDFSVDIIPLTLPGILPPAVPNVTVVVEAL